MRILFVADVAPDPDSGAAGTELQTAGALRALGHTVDTVWRDDLPHRVRHGNLHYLAELPWGYLRVVQERRTRAAYDVIHVNQPYGWRVARERRRRGWPGIVVNRSHGWEPNVTASLAPWRRRFGRPAWRFPRGIAGRPMRWVLEGLYCRWAARESDGIIVSSRLDRDFIRDRYRVPENRIAVIPQAAADAFLAGAAPAMTEKRLLRVLFVGQLSFVKGVAIAARVFDRLADRHPERTLTWCCEAAAHGRARAMLTPAARAAVRFLPWMPQQELVRVYDEHGIFLFPSFYEGFGKAFLEAMARGLCVVASDTGGMRDVIRPGINGFLCPVGDADAFIACIEDAAGVAAASGAMAAAAAATAREHTWQRVARETAGFYERLLSKRRPAS